MFGAGICGGGVGKKKGVVGVVGVVDVEDERDRKRGQGFHKGQSHDAALARRLALW